MAKYIIVILLLLPFASSAQKEIKLKRKYFGVYSGTVPGYRIESDNELLKVGPTGISIKIDKENVEVKVGNNVLRGTYDVMFKAKSYYLLDVNIEGQLANERIMVYKWGKRLSRDGMYPQPVTELKKQKGR